MDTNGHTNLCEDYVSFETAKLLKEKGFDIPLNYYYNSDGKKRYATSYNWNQTTGDFPDYSCPTLQMAMKWLREVHNIAVVVAPSMFWGKYNISIYRKGNDYAYGFDGDSLCPSYEQACESAIKYCLENLI